MQLRRRRPWTALVLLAAAGAARAEDRVTVRGVYYREPSTRVVQPMVDISKDVAGGFDVSAHYLIDSITSASVAAGVSTDNIFTEFRNEVGIGAGKTWGKTRLGIAYRYSAESDYWSHGASASLTHRFWGDTSTVAASFGRGADTAGSRFRTPICNPASGNTQTSTSCGLDLWFGGVSFTQVLSPVALGQISYEASYLDGYQGNLYRLVPGYTFEQVPTKRLRHAASLRAAYYVPAIHTGFQGQYRFYYDQYPGASADKLPEDPWQVVGHMVEGRVYQQIGHSLEARVSYRYYHQTAASFMCDVVANAGCFGTMPPFFSSDPKLGPVSTSLPELRLTWDAAAWRGVPFVGWFAAGAFEASYGYFIQSTSFANAHLAQFGYSMPY